MIRQVAILTALLSSCAPQAALAANKLPLVISSTGQTQQLQAADALTLPSPAGTLVVLGNQTNQVVSVVDTAWPFTHAQAPSQFASFHVVPNSTAWNGIQVMTLNGTVLSSTYTNYLATVSPDNVAVSASCLRGGSGSSSIVCGNDISFFENNSNIVWTREIDVENWGATQTEGSDNGGIGLALNTTSGYSPDTAVTVRRPGSGTGPGWLRGFTCEGVRITCIRAMAMDTTTYPGLTPAAPGTLTVLAAASSSDSAYRFTISESGFMDWGTGSGGGDVTLSRTSAGVLSVNGSGGGTVTAGLGYFGAMQSIVATGTPPLVVASTTNVANLNASSLNGNTFASPGAIGGTTPGVATFTTLGGAASSAPSFAVAAGAGTGATIACASTYRCDNVSGTFLLTTGTGPAGGTQATVTFGLTRTNLPNCVFNLKSGSAVAEGGATTTTATLYAAAALTASTAYQGTYVCMGN